MIDTTLDVWQYLAACQKPLVMYGMGNGADKILCALYEKGLEIADFFASDDFVRGQKFHDKTVLRLIRSSKNIVILSLFSRLAHLFHPYSIVLPHWMNNMTWLRRMYR